MHTMVGTPLKRFKIMMALQLFWITIVCALAGWWLFLLVKQSKRIAELEKSTSYLATQRMVFWESTTFFSLMVVVTGFLFWFHIRELKRTKQLHAFFASLTHELKTPLTGIRLQSEFLSDQLQGEKEKVLLSRLLQDASRLESQVERTLELARLEGGGLLHTQNFDLSQWLTRQIQTWSESFGKKILFEAHLTQNTISADPHALLIVFRNLIENAIRHSGKEALKLKLTTQDEGAFVTLVFSDNGSPALDQDSKLGTLFYKGKKSQGAGVGLYLVSGLMSKMKGRASFHSSDSGFEVKLTFLKAMEVTS